MTGMVCGDNRFKLIEKYKNKLIESTNIETAKDEMAVIDSILFRFWQMGWLDKLEDFDRQKAAIERLNVELVGMRGACESYKMHYDNAQAEIKRLQKAGKEAVSCFTRMESLYKIKCKELEVAKSEAIKEFAERLNARIRKDIDEQGMFPLPYTKKAYDNVKIFIDNLVKEMEGEQ